MDKTSMKPRTTNRHIHKKQQQSAFKKSKKEKLRSLSSVAKALSMGCNLSDHSHKSISTNNNFKLPKKVFNECGVDHSSVPRKIRSAMKKRGRESILTDSEKLNNGIESSQKDSIKKSKKQVVLGPITKDEQEVAETLFALAGMFPINDENEVDRRESVRKKLSVSQDREESTNVTYQGANEDAHLIAESSSKGAVKISSLSETVGVEQIDLPENEGFFVATYNTAPKVNLQGVPMMVKRSENDVKVELHDSGLCLAMGLNASTQSQISQNGRKLDVEYQTAGGIDSRLEQHRIKYQRENGLTLWPGSTPRASAATSASYLKSSAAAAAKAPHWLNTAISNSKHDLMESGSSGGKISKTAVHKKSWKSCAAHVHISQLIRSLELPKQQAVKEPELYECDQIRVHQGSKCEVLTEAPDSNRTGNGKTFATGTVQSASVENFPENKNGVLPQQCHYLDISLSQASPTPAKYGPQSQSFNFLSLSAGCNGLKVDDCFIKGGNRLGPFSKSQVPYLRSIQQQHGFMAIPTTSSQYTSTSYLDQLPASGSQVRLHQPHYYGTPLCGTQYSSTNSYKQQYQNIWAAQLVTQNGSDGVSSNLMRIQYPNWQNGRHETCAVNPGAQVMLPYHSLASLQPLGSKITSICDQQPFTPASSIPLSRTNGLEESRGRFHGSGASSLQLLCDERI